MINRIDGLGGRHMMCFGANAADTVGQQRHFFNRTANAEAFETAQFRDLEVGVGDIAFFVQEDFDLAVTFQPGDGINRNSLHVSIYPFCADLLARRQGTSQVEPIELPGGIHQAIQNLIDFFGLLLSMTEAKAVIRRAP